MTDMNPDLAALRREYKLAALDEHDLDADPLVLFARWFDAARQAGVIEPNGMTLATVSADGQPSARVVLLKDFDPAGFVFYTNYESRKGQELASNPRAALLFWWSELERQVRIEGSVEPVAAAESDAYFAARPWYSQIGAWASAQSRLIENREVLESSVLALAQRFAGQPVPRPPHWGGYRLAPLVVEFWQGRESRLHDRIRYRRPALGAAWQIERLSP